MDFVIPGATVKNIMTKGHSQNTKTSSNGILKTMKIQPNKFSRTAKQGQ